MKINFISPSVLFIETDRSQMISKNKKQVTRGNSSSVKNTPNINPIVVTNFILQEDGFYLLQEDGSKLYL